MKYRGGLGMEGRRKGRKEERLKGGRVKKRKEKEVLDEREEER